MKFHRIPQQFKTLFWEFDLAEINIHNHKEFIIERLLEKGNLETVRWLFKTYSEKDINQVITNSDNISTSTQYFWQTFFNYHE